MARIPFGTLNTENGNIIMRGIAFKILLYKNNTTTTRTTTT